MEPIKLTSFSHGAGCGCKIAPAILDKILSTSRDSGEIDPNLLVGNSTNDDAAVYDIGNGQAIISTTDFFMPIVDDPFDFGAIASVNAISDVYAMGGKPLVAIAILGWPIDKISEEHASRMLDGSRAACAKAGIKLAGGHSIDSPEPIFGLAVTGMVSKKHIKLNSSAQPGSTLYLTKQLGVGIVTTAEKRGIAEESDIKAVKESMLTLNDIGSKVGEQDYVVAMTDVTGFGLLGHLKEICDGSNISANINFSKVPVFPFLDKYLDQGCSPGGTNRNLASYGNDISGLNDHNKSILADPQTSGGLLIAIEGGYEKEFEQLCSQEGYDLRPFGITTERQEEVIKVE